jgi:hypothetical protein
MNYLFDQPSRIGRGAISVLNHVRLVFVREQVFVVVGLESNGFRALEKLH